MEIVNLLRNFIRYHKNLESHPQGEGEVTSTGHRLL